MFIDLDWLKMAAKRVAFTALVFVWGYSCAATRVEAESRVPIPHLDRMYGELQAGTWAPLDKVFRDTLDRRITKMRAAIRKYEDR